jgi:hypothetical protein
MRWTLAILMLFQIALGANAGDTADVPIKLAVTFSHELTLPGFSFSGNAQCDASGNLYFHSGFDGNDSLVLKLRTDGTSTVVRLPDKEATETYFLAFRVSPDGSYGFWTADAKATREFTFLNLTTIRPARSELIWTLQKG